MARLTIENLPVVETLTQEEEESIFGAGRRSFRPMLESLENREMMDAGLGFGLQVPLAGPTGGAPQVALVRQLAGETMQQVNNVVGSAMQTAQQVNHFVHSTLQTAQTAYSAAHQAVIDQIFAGLGHQNLPQGQQQAFSVQGDSSHVAKRAEQFLKDHIIEGSTMKNRWGLEPDYVYLDSTKVNGDRITVRFGLLHALWGKPNRCFAEFIFEGKNTGDVKRYEMVGAGLHGWKNIFGGGDTMFEGVAKELFRNKVDSFEFQRFDGKAFVNNLLRQTEKMFGVHEGKFELNKFERIDGGYRISIFTDNNRFSPRWQGDHRPEGRGELLIGFKYDDAQLAKGFVNVSEFRQGFWYQRWAAPRGAYEWVQTWHDYGDRGVHDLIRRTQWKLGA